MAACFSGVRARLLGVGVKVLPQPWAKQRHLADPLRLVPNLITSFLVPQCGHGKATMTAPYTNNAIRSIAARDFLRANRRSNIHLYPDDWKKLPVPDATPAEQSDLVALVDNILTARRANPTADIAAWEAQIDTRVAALYGL